MNGCETTAALHPLNSLSWCCHGCGCALPEQRKRLMLGSTPPSPSLSVAGWQWGSTSDAGRVLSVSSLSPGVSVLGQTEPPAASSFVPLVCAECSAEEEERERGKGGRKREGEERGRKKGGGGGEVIHSHSCIHYLHLCLVIMSVFFLGVYRLCEQNEQNKTRVTCTLVTHYQCPCCVAVRADTHQS